MRRSYPEPLILIACLTSLCLALLARADEGEVPGPRLDPLDGFATGSIARVTGSDPGAPRALVLWLWDGTGFGRIATTRSNPTGRFDFGMQTLPGEGAGLDVTIEGGRPDPARRLRAEPPLTAPILVSGGLDSDGPIELVIAPALPRGELRVTDRQTGRLLLREPIAPRDRGRITLDLTNRLARPWPETIAIEQILEDGRRSPRLFWRLTP